VFYHFGLCSDTVLSCCATVLDLSTRLMLQWKQLNQFKHKMILNGSCIGLSLHSSVLLNSSQISFSIGSHSTGLQSASSWSGVSSQSQTMAQTSSTTSLFVQYFLRIKALWMGSWTEPAMQRVKSLRRLLLKLQRGIKNSFLTEHHLVRHFVQLCLSLKKSVKFKI